MMQWSQRILAWLLLTGPLVLSVWGWTQMRENWFTLFITQGEALTRWGMMAFYLFCFVLGLAPLAGFFALRRRGSSSKQRNRPS